MISKRITGATHYLGAPKGWNPPKDGECRHLSVRHADGIWQSAWEPTPAELALLNAGGSVVLSVYGIGQPPVMLSVEPAMEEVTP